MTGQQERAPGRPRAPRMCGINRVCVWVGVRGQWVWPGSLAENISDTFRSELRNWDQHRKSSAAPKLGFHQDQRLLSGPSSWCFLLPFLRLPDTLPPVSAAWADGDSCPETHPLASGLQAQLPGPALPNEACAGQSVEHHSASTQHPRNREVSADPTHRELPSPVIPASKIPFCVFHILPIPDLTKYSCPPSHCP